jgi:hypothetical protein
LSERQASAASPRSQPQDAAREDINDAYRETDELCERWDNRLTIKNLRIYPLTPSDGCEVIGNGFLEAYLTPRFLLPKVADMHVPEKVRRSVVFIGSKDKDGTFRPRATGFLVLTHSIGADQAFTSLVTAEHVVSGMLTKNMEIHCRLNMKNGGAEVVSLRDVSPWWFHPNAAHDATDVAVAGLGFNRDTVDHDYMPILEYPRGLGEASPPRLGDEVFIVGLFKSHFGKQRNRPIIRIGNISAMPEEPVFTRYCGYIDAFLIEARSISGLSGSPVFVNVPETPPAGIMLDPRFLTDSEEVQWARYHFLGLMHGHFDLEKMAEDSVTDDTDESKGINSGIGVVVPASKVIETLYQPELKEMRQKVEREIRKHRGATADVDLSDDTVESI